MADRESRLDELAREALARGEVTGAAVPVAGGPIPPASPSYYGQPVLKAPVWTWEVPAYFVVGGIAGMSAAIAAVAGLSGADPAIARDARLVALLGALVSPVLLISDLGRPTRFLNMLRVFKLQSAMSVGAWTLVAFSGATSASVVLHAVDLAGPLAAVRASVDVMAALLGLVLATYTGVLLGVSAVPVWAANASRLPLLFAASSLGAAIATLELLGHRTEAANTIGIVAATAELGVGVYIGWSGGRASASVRSGEAARWLWFADAGGAGLPLVLRLAWSTSTPARVLAAAATIAGAVALRYGWMAAGRVSTRDPSVVLGREPSR